MAACLLSQLPMTFSIGCVRLAEADVVGDGVVEQIYVLEHEAEIFHKAVHAVFPHVDARPA